MKKTILAFIILFLLAFGCTSRSSNLVEFSDSYAYIKSNDAAKNSELMAEWQSLDVSYVEVKNMNYENNKNLVTVSKYGESNIQDWFNKYANDATVEINNNIIPLTCGKIKEIVACMNEDYSVVKYVYLKDPYIVRLLCVSGKLDDSKQICDDLYEEIDKK